MSNLILKKMKSLVLVFGLMVSFGSFAIGDYKGASDYKGYKGSVEGGYGGYITAFESVISKPDAPKGFNYKKHARRTKFVRFMNRTFNLNNCKGKSHHNS